MIARPERVEAAQYYFSYIDRVPEDSDVIDMLESQLAEGSTLFSQISEAMSLHRYAPGKWSIRELLNHVSDAERLFAFRALWFARGFDSALPSFDQNTAVSHAHAHNVAWAAHVEEFKRVRSATISLFQNMPTDAWLRSGVASDNHFTVRAVAFLTAGHFIHHVTLLRERYL